MHNARVTAQGEQRFAAVDRRSSPEAPGPGPSETLTPTPWLRAQLLVTVTVIVGMMLRLLQYGGNRSLWLDEVLMVPTITRPSFIDLLRPSNWNHIPPGFLFLTKLSVTALGSGDWVLRLLPFVAAIASLFLFAAVARRTVSARAMPIAVALFALSPFLIYYASELKPYSTDVAITLTLLLVAPLPGIDRITARRTALFGIVAIFAAGLSLTSVFVSFGIALALLAETWRSRDDNALRSVISVLLVWCVVFGAPYILFVHGSATNEYAREFWRSGFMPLPPTSLADLAWFPRTFFQIFRDPLGVFSDQHSASAIWGPAAAVLAFAIGARVIGRRHPLLLASFVAPLLLTLLASGLMIYPFGGSRAAAGRVILFLIPLFFLVIAEGAAAVWEWLRGRARIVPVALLVLLLGPSLVWGAVAVPMPRTEIKPLLEYLEHESRPGDILYAHYDIRHAFEHYAADYDLGGLLYQRGVCSRDQPARYLDSLSHFQGAPRIWILFGNGQGAGLFDEKVITIDFLEHIGDRLDDQITYGASLYLYDLRSPEVDLSTYRTELPTVPLSIADGCELWN